MLFSMSAFFLLPSILLNPPLIDVSFHLPPVLPLFLYLFLFLILLVIFLFLCLPIPLLHLFFLPHQLPILYHLLLLILLHHILLFSLLLHYILHHHQIHTPMFCLLLPFYLHLLFLENPLESKPSLGTCRITTVSWLLLYHLRLLPMHKIQVFLIPYLILFPMKNCLLLTSIFAFLFLLKLNLNFTMRLSLLVIGVMLCQLRFQLWRLIKLRLFVIFHLINTQSAVNGFIRLNTKPMVALKDIRLV